MTVIAVLGLGEAGGRIAAGLAAAGAAVVGFDPRQSAPAGVRAASGDADACRDAGLVLSVNSAHDALDALRQSLPALRPGTIWADLNTSSPALKTALRDAAGDRASVVDVALMAPVPGRGLRTPMTMSGPAAARAAALLGAYGAEVEVLNGPVGEAATRKLLRSVFYKGLAAAADLLTELGVAPRVAAASRDWLADLAARVA